MGSFTLHTELRTQTSAGVVSRGHSWCSDREASLRTFQRDPEGCLGVGMSQVPREEVGARLGPQFTTCQV